MMTVTLRSAFNIVFRHAGDPEGWWPDSTFQTACDLFQSRRRAVLNSPLPDPHVRRASFRNRGFIEKRLASGEDREVADTVSGRHSDKVVNLVGIREIEPLDIRRVHLVQVDIIRDLRSRAVLRLDQPKRLESEKKHSKAKSIYPQ